MEANDSRGMASLWDYKPGFQRDHFSFFYFSISWSKMTIYIEVNNEQPIPLTCYLFITLIFRLLI